MEMEMESSSPVVAKKLWSIVRVLFFMLRKGIAKSKIMSEFHVMVKRGKKALVNNLMINYTTTSRSHHNNTFISPYDYEFSCSNSPANIIPFHALKRNNKMNHHHHHHHHASTFTALHKVLEMLNENNNSPLPAFGKTPIGRQLRVTDSPFPLKDQGDSQVDVAAEEFIKNFFFVFRILGDVQYYFKVFTALFNKEYRPPPLYP
ncbi:hypothetical protein CR513_38932, partial [Mucuna pruriens]